MPETETLSVESRNSRGKWQMRRLRAEGIVPGIVYGHGIEPQAVQLPAADLERVVRHGSRVIDLKLAGATEKALIRDLQWDPFGIDILHVDFARVSADERIRVEVRVELRGTAPGVEEGGVLEHYIHTVPVECLATEIPQEIRVVIRDLHKGQAIHVRELQVPAGVKVLADPDVVVVQVVEPVVEEPVAAVAEAGPAEPEIVGRRVAAEPEEGEEAAEKKPAKK